MGRFLTKNPQTWVPFLTPKSLNMGPFFVKITKIFRARVASPENFQKIPKHGSIFWAKSLNMGTFFTSKHGLGSRGPGGTPPVQAKVEYPPRVDDDNPISPFQRPRGYAGVAIIWNKNLTHHINKLPVWYASSSMPVAIGYVSLTVTSPACRGKGSEDEYSECLDEVTEILYEIWFHSPHHSYGGLECLFEPWNSGGGPHIDMVYVYVPAFWGAFSRNLV